MQCEHAAPVYLCLHKLGTGDVLLPIQARYDGANYKAKFIIDDTLPRGRATYDAVSVYDNYFRRLDLIPLSGARTIVPGDVARVQIASDTEYN